ncbi:receptor expression-enhancing protein 3 [Hemitrygon akajei]|uniref:receptor expression-enhancing protein 3 n=1 Tax=Hemitrygon akajei TaxID=2704970 RepID=UPI003BF9D542
MVSWIISRTVVLVFGTLYPAYYSYKAVKTKNVKEYVRWMMYWIVFALYTVLETFADLTIAWFPLYYELKVAFVIWLLSPYTRGAGVLYRKFLHPLLSSREREIDDYISQAKDRSYDTMVRFGKQGLNFAATAAVSAAVKSQGAITEKLRSLSMHDLTAIQGDEPVGHRSLTGDADIRKKMKQLPKEDFARHFDYDDVDSEDRSEIDQNSAHSDDEVVTQKHLQRSQSLKVKRKGHRKEVRYGSLKLKPKKRPQCSYIPG